MLFKWISHKIALQFTAFVFVLLLVTGSIFIAVDMENRNHRNHTRLESLIAPFQEDPSKLAGIPYLPPFQREQIRIVDADKNAIYSGSLYDDIPFEDDKQISRLERGHDEYDILTAPITRDGKLVGYIQIGDRTPPNDLEERIFLFLAISAGISALTFGVGLFFAKRSLKPAEEMMERLEQFTQDASHELKTPLTAVSTSLDLALLTKESHEHISDAKKDLKDISTLIDRLLELARLDTFSLQKESVDFSSLVTEAVEKHKLLAKNLTFESKIEPNIKTSGDPTLIRQVVSNLLTNAMKFNTPTGKITVMLTKHTLSVSDTGKGISGDAIAHVFDRFYREEASRSKTQDGLGLGLALVKRIVDLHGWTITVESKEGKGTTFTVHFA